MDSHGEQHPRERSLSKTAPTVLQERRRAAPGRKGSSDSPISPRIIGSRSPAIGSPLKSPERPPLKSPRAVPGSSSPGISPGNSPGSGSPPSPLQLHREARTAKGNGSDASTRKKVQRLGRMVVRTATDPSKPKPPNFLASSRSRTRSLAPSKPTVPPSPALLVVNVENAILAAHGSQYSYQSIERMVSVWGDKLNKKELERRRLVEEREAVCKEIESLITDVREAEEDYQEQGVEMQINLLQRVAELVKSNADYVSGLLAHKETPFAKVYNDNAKASDIPFTFEEPPPKSAHSGEDANEAAEDAKATPAHKTPAEAATENGGDHGVELAGDVVQERSHVSKKHQKRRRSKTSDGVRVKLSDLQMSHCNEQLLPLTTLLEGLEGLHVVGNVFMNNLLSAEAVHLCHDNDALKKSISLLRSAKKGLERDAVALRGVATYHTVTNYDLGRLIRLLEHCDASVRSMFDDQVRLNRWSKNFSEESALDLADTVDTMKRISMKFASLQVEGGRTVTLDDLNPATVTEQFDRAWISATDVAQLQGIPLEQLINLVLCCSPGTMPLYDLVLRTFFMTLEYYMSSGLFLERLMLRYCIVPDAALVRDLEKEAPVLLKRKHQTPVRKQVLKLLRYWLANFFFRDFFLNAANLQMVTNFIGHTVVPTGNKGEGQALLKLIEQAVEDNARAAEEREKQFREVEQEVEAEAGSVQKLRVYKPTITDNYLKNKLKSFVQEPVRPLAMVGLPAGESVVASALLLLEVDVQDLAHQITLMESKCYADIQIRELLQQVWNNKQRRDTAAPTLMWVFRHFNSVSRWIVDALLSEREARRRARVMRRVLLLAMHLLAMNNYNGLMEVMSGINSTAVDRLWATWHAVGPQLYAVKELLSTLTLSSLKMYRYQWSTTLAPCVPYIGLSLTDLTFFEDGNPSFLTAKKGNKQKLLNFQKFLKVEKTISGLLHYQDFPYSLPYCPKVYNPLADTLDQLARQPLSDEDTYERSTACEPQEVTQPFKKKLSALQTEFDISKPEEFIKEFHKLRQHVFLEKEVISVHPSPLTEAPVPIAKLPRHVRFSENPSDDPTLVRVLVDSSTLLDIAADLRDELPGKTCRWRLKQVPNSQPATEIVTWLVNNVDFVQERGDGARLADALLRRQLLLVPDGCVASVSFRDKARDLYTYPMWPAAE